MIWVLERLSLFMHIRLVVYLWCKSRSILIWCGGLGSDRMSFGSTLCLLSSRRIVLEVGLSMVLASRIHCLLSVILSPFISRPLGPPPTPFACRCRVIVAFLT